MTTTDTWEVPHPPTSPMLKSIEGASAALRAAHLFKKHASSIEVSPDRRDAILKHSSNMSFSMAETVEAMVTERRKRSDTQVASIVQFLSLSSGIVPSDLIEPAVHLYGVKLKQKTQAVYRKNESVCNVFMVIKGAVAISEYGYKKAQSFNLVDSDLYYDYKAHGDYLVADIQPGGWFGEEEIYAGCAKRYYDATASEDDTVIIKIAMDIYKENLGLKHASAYEAKIDFLTHVKDLPIPYLTMKKLAPCFQLMAFKRFDVIVREGEPADALYIIQEGTACVVKDPSFNVAEKGKVAEVHANKVVQVCHLAEKAIIGQVHILSSNAVTQRTASVVAHSATVHAYRIKRALVMEVLTPSQLEDLTRVAEQKVLVRNQRRQQEVTNSAVDIFQGRKAELLRGRSLRELNRAHQSCELRQQNPLQAAALPPKSFSRLSWSSKEKDVCNKLMRASTSNVPFLNDTQSFENVYGTSPTQNRSLSSRFRQSLPRWSSGLSDVYGLIQEGLQKFKPGSVTPHTVGHKEMRRSYSYGVKGAPQLPVSEALDLVALSARKESLTENLELERARSSSAAPSRMSSTKITRSCSIQQDVNVSCANGLKGHQGSSCGFEEMKQKNTSVSVGSPSIPSSPLGMSSSPFSGMSSSPFSGMSSSPFKCEDEAPQRRQSSAASEAPQRRQSPAAFGIKDDSRSLNSSIDLPTRSTSAGIQNRSGSIRSQYTMMQLLLNNTGGKVLSGRSQLSTSPESSSSSMSANFVCERSGLSASVLENWRKPLCRLPKPPGTISMVLQKSETQLQHNQTPTITLRDQVEVERPSLVEVERPYANYKRDGKILSGKLGIDMRHHVINSDDVEGNEERESQDVDLHTVISTSSKTEKLKDSRFFRPLVPKAHLRTDGWRAPPTTLRHGE